MADLSPFGMAGYSVEEILGTSRDYNYSGDPRLGALEELHKEGFKTYTKLVIGRMTRVDAPDDKAGQKTGWYIYYEDVDSADSNRSFGVLTYGSWRGHPEKVTWCSKSQHGMSAEDRIYYQARIDQARIEREREQEDVYAEAASRARQIWETSESANSDNGYLTRKGIKASSGVRESRGSLIVPVVNNSGAVVSLQFIKPNGTKKFLTGGRMKGCWFRIDGNPDIIYITEGYATGYTVHEATGGTVYVVFTAGNIYDVTSHVRNTHKDSAVTIAADNDRFTVGNTGITKARQAADALECGLIYPEFVGLVSNGTDFNDLASEEGMDAVKKCFDYRSKMYRKSESIDIIAEASNAYLFRPEGVLGDIVNYYHATAGEKQDGFAVQCALALGSLICGRNFKTNFNNFSSLYFLNIGKSAGGKDHAKTVINTVLLASNMHNLIAANGYSSGAAVFSMLYEYPRHIAIIDEFGKYLIAAGKDQSGNAVSANSEIMQSFSSCHSFLKAKAYSMVGMAKDKKKELIERHVLNPALTMIGMSTPDIFDSLRKSDIKDGFLNRIVISISDAPRSVRKHKEPMDVPQSILEWVKAINERRGMLNDVPADKPNLITLTFTEEAIKVQEDFQKEIIGEQERLDKVSMAEILGRANEIAMRLSLIIALGKDPNAEAIDADSMKWGVDYSRHHIYRFMKEARRNISSSDHESSKLKVLNALRDNGEISQSDMYKTPPYSQFTKKVLVEILTELDETDLIVREPIQSGKRGRPSFRVFATK